MWGNLLCLLLLSNRARDALAPLSRATRYMADCIVTICTLGRDDRLEDLDLPPEFLQGQDLVQTDERSDVRPSPQVV